MAYDPAKRMADDFLRSSGKREPRNTDLAAVFGISNAPCDELACPVSLFGMP